jgi:hypothetical protein
MLLAPECRCRVVLDDKLIIGRGYQGAMLTEAVVRLGTSVATAKPTQIEELGIPGGPMSHVFAMGPGGPTIAFETIGAQMGEMFARIDVTGEPGLWAVLARSFAFELPAGGLSCSRLIRRRIAICRSCTSRSSWALRCRSRRRRSIPRTS